ncbi:gamma-glutamylcyclotransferase family protein [Synechococcus sp. CBW1107]|uniref:gamma-glutamylcyclotransferase family protein n=1 Tax=Synechococcus sp. CBW1107 TaxID=2789857 RepID=UPI003A0FFA1D
MRTGSPGEDGVPRYERPQFPASLSSISNPQPPSPPIPPINHVFIYGSLKRGQSNHHWLRGALFLGRHRLAGDRLYSLGGYPMAVLEDHSSAVIHGEVFMDPVHAGTLGPRRPELLEPPVLKLLVEHVGHGDVVDGDPHARDLREAHRPAGVELTVEEIPVLPQLIALQPGLGNRGGEVLAGLGLHVAGNADPAPVVDAFGVPELMGPQPEHGDAGEYPLVKGLEPIQPVLQVSIGGDDIQVSIGGDDPHPHRRGLTDLLGGTLGPHPPQLLQHGRQIHQAAAVDLGDGLDPVVEPLQVGERVHLHGPAQQPLGIRRVTESGNPQLQVVDGVDAAALLADPHLDIGDAGLHQALPAEARGPATGRQGFGPLALAMALQTQIPGPLDVLVAAVQERSQGELPHLDPLHQFAHVDRRAPVVAA